MRVPTRGQFLQAFQIKGLAVGVRVALSLLPSA
jgi:hypothetical protein